MSAPQFTPGPWRIDGNSLVHGPDEHGERRTIAILRFNFRHNADLIAASPELYEALDQLLHAIHPATQRVAAEKARKVLAKARGDQ